MEYQQYTNTGHKRSKRSFLGEDLNVDRKTVIKHHRHKIQSTKYIKHRV